MVRSTLCLAGFSPMTGIKGLLCLQDAVYCGINFGMQVIS